MKGFKKHQGLTKRQIRVFKHARRRIKHCSWYRGICLDNFPIEEAIKQDFRRCVQLVVMETEMWDNHDLWDSHGSCGGGVLAYVGVGTTKDGQPIIAEEVATSVML